MPTPSEMRRQEWRSGWTLVLACAFGFSFSSIINYTFGLFIDPLVTEFHWSRAQVSSGLAISGVVSVLLSPVVGWLIDHWGLRRLVLPGIVLLTLSIMSFALFSGNRTQWIVLWAVFSVLDLAVKSTVWTTAVSYAFNAARSLALAFTLGGVSLALIAGPPVAQALIAELGWRMAFVAIGGLWGSVALVLNVLFLRDARKAVSNLSGGNPAAHAETPGLSVAEAIRTPALLRIGIATFLTMLVGLGVQVHLVPILNSGGISRESAAYLASLSGIAGIAGKLVTGWLMDRVDARLIGSITLALSAAAFALLLDGVRTLPLTLVAMVVIGYAAAAKLQICAFMTGQHAGMRNFGTIFGFMSSLIALGGGMGPFVTGLVFDHFDSYDPVLLTAVAASFLSAFLIFGLKPAPDWVASESQSADKSAETLR